MVGECGHTAELPKPRVNAAVSDAMPSVIHARITPDPESGYVATCEEIAVVTQARPSTR